MFEELTIKINNNEPVAQNLSQMPTLSTQPSQSIMKQIQGRPHRKRSESSSSGVIDLTSKPDKDNLMNFLDETREDRTRSGNSSNPGNIYPEIKNREIIDDSPLMTTPDTGYHKIDKLFNKYSNLKNSLPRPVPLVHGYDNSSVAMEVDRHLSQHLERGNQPDLDISPISENLPSMGLSYELDSIRRNHSTGAQLGNYGTTLNQTLKKLPKVSQPALQNTLRASASLRFPENSKIDTRYNSTLNNSTHSSSKRPRNWSWKTPGETRMKFEYRSNEFLQNLNASLNLPSKRQILTGTVEKQVSSMLAREKSSSSPDLSVENIHEINQDHKEARIQLVQPKKKEKKTASNQLKFDLSSSTQGSSSKRIDKVGKLQRFSNKIDLSQQKTQTQSKSSPKLGSQRKQIFHPQMHPMDTPQSIEETNHSSTSTDQIIQRVNEQVEQHKKSIKIARHQVTKEGKIKPFKINAKADSTGRIESKSHSSSYNTRNTNSSSSKVARKSKSYAQFLNVDATQQKGKSQNPAQNTETHVSSPLPPKNNPKALQNKDHSHSEKNLVSQDFSEFSIRKRNSNSNSPKNFKRANIWLREGN